MYTDQTIPVYSIFVHPYDLKELRSDIWCDDPVLAKLRTGKKQYDVEFVYRGSHIRKFPKKSYHCTFLNPSRFHGAKEIHLNAEYVDPSLIRNKLSLDFFSSIGTLSPESRHVLLKINGKFQGVYLQLESVDELFLKKRGLPDGAIYYAEDDDANFSLFSSLDKDLKRSFESGYSRKCGDDEDDKALKELIYKINTTPRIDFETEIQKYIHVEKYLRWLAGVVCTQNFDGFIHNYAIYYNSQSRLFELIPWDYDATWGYDINGRDMEYDYVPIEGYNTLTARVLDVQAFRHQYQQIMKGILDDHFTVSALRPKIESMYRMIRPYIAKDPYKKDEVDQFDQEPQIIERYIKDRGRYLRKHLSDLD
jgi:spore coat protein H